MIEMKQIETYAAQIGREFHPHKIILFGSYANNQAGPNSDVDLLIVMPFSGKAWKKAVEIRTSISFPFAVDLILRTPEEIDRRLSSQDPFICHITRTGRVLYAA